MSAYNEYMREYNAKRYKTKRIKYEEMLGGKCSRCESTDNLHFDHIDPSTKEYNIGNILLGREDRVIQELQKCQLLCETCHHKKTAEELKKREPHNKGNVTHGKHYAAYILKCKCKSCLSYRKERNAKRRKS